MRLPFGRSAENSPAKKASARRVSDANDFNNELNQRDGVFVPQGLPYYPPLQQPFAFAPYAAAGGANVHQQPIIGNQHQPMSINAFAMLYMPMMQHASQQQMQQPLIMMQNPYGGLPYMQIGSALPQQIVESETSFLGEDFNRGLQNIPQQSVAELGTNGRQTISASGWSDSYNKEQSRMINMVSFLPCRMARLRLRVAKQRADDPSCLTIFFLFCIADVRGLRTIAKMGSAFGGCPPFSRP